MGFGSNSHEVWHGSHGVWGGVARGLGEVAQGLGQGCTGFGTRSHRVWGEVARGLKRGDEGLGQFRTGFGSGRVGFGVGSHGLWDDLAQGLERCRTRFGVLADSLREEVTIRDDDLPAVGWRPAGVRNHFFPHPGTWDETPMEQGDGGLGLGKDRVSGQPTRDDL